ncbi:uncharacterized protein LOC122091025 isoform X4 [Macadamia integrifolia]|uniref:uncharacterized protein LOC122091025 isoform X4 n=1 Tax=Macadamia integrifolia TaxID=60698 RepID=UPI001C4EB7FE|nr:uncharacterized protein LOC122091025 isoform X4 [Macadamia integrifolia]
MILSLLLAYRKSQEPAVDKLKEATMDEITSALVSRYELNFTRQDTASLWFLCKQEASLLDITDRACSIFSPFEIWIQLQVCSVAQTGDLSSIQSHPLPREEGV